MKIAKKFVYDGYINVTIDGDVALFKLAEDLPLDDPSKHLGPICLPEEREPLDAKAGKEFTVSGWGQIMYDWCKFFLINKFFKN